MAIVASDLPASISTQYEVWFNQTYNQFVIMTEQQLAPLVMDMTLGDFQGNLINVNWLGGAPQLRRWVDEKRAQAVSRYSYQVGIERWEATMRIDMDALRDARWNVYEPKIREMAQNASRHRYNLISALVRGGEAGICYDGQFFYDTDHVEGASGTQSNLFTGTGVTIDKLTADYYAAKSRLMGFRDDKGEVWHGYDFRPLIWIPNDPVLIQNFTTLKLAGILANNGTNILVNDFDLQVDPNLTDATDWHMFRTDLAGFKPFIFVNREAIHYEDNFGTGHPDVWSRRFGEASSVGRDSATYGLWQGSLKVKNAG